MGNVSAQAAELPLASLTRQSPLLHPRTIHEQHVAMAHGAFPPSPLHSQARHNLSAQSRPGQTRGGGTWLTGPGHCSGCLSDQLDRSRLRRGSSRHAPSLPPLNGQLAPGQRWVQWPFWDCPQRESGRTLGSSTPGSNIPGGSARKYSRKFLDSCLPRQKGTAFLPRRAWPRGPSWQKLRCPPGT